MPEIEKALPVESSEKTERDDDIKDDDIKVEDESEKSEAIPRVSFDISAYGADYDVDGLIKRLEKDDIFVPSFQRSYVWSLAQASKFVESLLLGLPVPGIFLAREEATNRMQVLDGQQRLKTLLFFRKEKFNPSPEGKYQRVFSLADVQEPFAGETYSSLEDRDRRRFDDSIIHATIVKQETPKNDDTSIYHIFQRLNSGSVILAPQEIRCAVYHGAFIDLLKNLNELASWRTIYGKNSRRLKDEELILRFLALHFDKDNYQRPMVEFLNKFAKKHKDRHQDDSFLLECSKLFASTIDIALKAFGDKAFRREGALNAAIFDSVMVALAGRLAKGPLSGLTPLNEQYGKLLVDEKYVVNTSRSTADETAVDQRLKIANDYFART